MVGGDIRYMLLLVFALFLDILHSDQLYVYAHIFYFFKKKRKLNI
jgi:hypothetical protein